MMSPVHSRRAEEQDRGSIMRRVCPWMILLVVGGALAAIVLSLTVELLGPDTDQK